MHSVLLSVKGLPSRCANYGISLYLDLSAIKLAPISVVGMGRAEHWE
ncbi:hypothetical protein [Teredinibacter sp. KSP-S5-2]|nr:hypothetical protein [Teredinibacter sp. KSP-S5-2]WNO08459.1 hypothetical protein P5V12_15925 [Teredinibacter sp. KSP-S5-2]